MGRICAITGRRGRRFGNVEFRGRELYALKAGGCRNRGDVCPSAFVLAALAVGLV